MSTGIRCIEIEPFIAADAWQMTTKWMNSSSTAHDCPQRSRYHKRVLPGAQQCRRRQTRQINGKDVHRSRTLVNKSIRRPGVQSFTNPVASGPGGRVTGTLPSNMLFLRAVPCRPRRLVLLLLLQGPLDGMPAESATSGHTPSVSVSGSRHLCGACEQARKDRA